MGLFLSVAEKFSNCQVLTFISESLISWKRIKIIIFSSLLKVKFRPQTPHALSYHDITRKLSKQINETSTYFFLPPAAFRSPPPPLSGGHFTNESYLFCPPTLLLSPETCLYQLHTPFKLQRLSLPLNTPPHTPFVSVGVFPFRVSEHIWISLHAGLCARHRWCSAGDSDYCGHSITAPSRLSSAIFFFSWKRGWEGKDKSGV